MGMTMTQKILANAAGKESVKAGELIMANLNLVLGNDITTPVAIGEFDKIGLDGVFDKAKVALVPDHFTPNKDIKSAQQALKVRTFAKEQDIVNYFEVGEVGIEHALLPEKGLVVAGDVVIGTDSRISISSITRDCAFVLYSIAQSENEPCSSKCFFI